MLSVRPHVANRAESARDAGEAACSSLDEAVIRIKTCRLTRNTQLGDPVAWLNLTLADGRELDDVALYRSPGGLWFFQGRGWLSAELAAMVGRCTERPPRRTIACGTRRGTKPPGGRRCGIRGETTNGWPGCAIG